MRRKPRDEQNGVPKARAGREAAVLRIGSIKHIKPKDSGVDAPGGHTRSHPEHDG